MTSMLTDTVDQKYAHALAEFDALTQGQSNPELLTRHAVQTIATNLPVVRCQIYRRGKDSGAAVLAASAGLGEHGSADDLGQFAAAVLERHEHGLTQPIRNDGTLFAVIEGDSAPFGVCVADPGAAARFTCDDLQFVQTIAGTLSGTLKRAHSERDKARLTALVASADDAIIEVTGDGRIFNWNTAAEILFGYSRSAIVGQSLTALLDAPEAAEAEEMLDAVCGGLAPGPHETTCRRIDGSPIDVVMRAAPIMLPDGRITAATLTVRDLREQRATDKQLRMQHDILAQMPAALMIWRLDDPDDTSSLRLVLANREASMATGCALDKCIGSRFADIAFSPVVASDAELYANVARTGVPRDLGEYPGSHRQEVRPWYHVHALPLPDGCVGVVFQDVTERRALTDQLHHAQRMEVVGRLAGGVAHDFNNILTIVNGYSELLQVKLENQPSALEDLAEIDRAAELAQQLTRQLLAFGRRQTLRPAPLDLTALAKSARGMLGRLLGEDIQLCVIGAEPVTVMADAGQIDQVLLNLAVNARDAMPAGGKLFIESSVTHVVHAVERQSSNDPSTHVPPGTYGMLTVSDTGLGMDASTLTRIFEPFFTTKEAGKGTGLGLSTVHGIVKQSGGHITVRSESGQGTTFKIYLPMINGRAIPIDAPSAAPVRPSSAPATFSRTVLLVEDDDAVRYLVRRILAASGLTVLEAAGPTEALETVAQFKGNIDLLLSDVVMAGHSGPELGNQMKLKFPGIQIIYMSGYLPNGAGHRKVPTDARFLQKPFSRDELMKTVREAMHVM